MKNRLPVLILLIVLVLGACASAQVSHWDTVSYDKWGFSMQVPAGSVKQPLQGAGEGGTYDVYAAKGLACVVRVDPASRDLPSSTVIEQAIQTSIREASKLGPAKRWEQTSKQGDLFKGYTGNVTLSKEDPVHAAIAKIVGSDSTFECAAMAPVGDDSSPILRVSVIGPSNRETEVITTARGIAAFVSRTFGTAKATAPKPVEPVDESKPEPAVPSKPWPALKKGDIELAGVVESINPDRKSLVLVVDLVTMPGAEPTVLSPARSKRVLLKSKLGGVSVGQRVRLIGRNTGIGKPIRADVLERTLEKQPTNAPARPIAPATV